eukprot:jgi/Galph1/287/GphlegSOOS_G5053.1
MDCRTTATATFLRERYCCYFKSNQLLRYRTISACPFIAVAAVAASADWVRHAVTITVEVPIEIAFDLYSNLEKMPMWSPWLQSARVDPKQPELATWKLAARGLSVSWRSKNTKVDRPHIISWESIDGLPNRGSVKFEEKGEELTEVELTVEYRVPSFLRILLSNSFVSSFVDRTLLDDLKRFRLVALREYSEQRRIGNISSNRPNKS